MDCMDGWRMIEALRGGGWIACVHEVSLWKFRGC